MVNIKISHNERINEVDLFKSIPDNPYLLLTPGPLSTSKSVRAAMLFDLCTWDEDYTRLTQRIRKRLVNLSTNKPENYTCVLMQGSGTFCIEAVLGSIISKENKLLILANGAYGRRMVEISRRLELNYLVNDGSEIKPPDLLLLKETLENDKEITHVAFVHCETTTGILNPLEEIMEIAKKYNKKVIVDAMSSFGGIEIDVEELGIDFLVSSSNKCIEGVPGFGFIIADIEELKKTKGNSKSLSLDIYDQWAEMEAKGKWRFTSPTHVVRAFYQALLKLEIDGGIRARFYRYSDNQKLLLAGMKEMGFKCPVPEEFQSPIITSFFYPESSFFSFDKFYFELKNNGFVIYPGKISDMDSFRIGNIGRIFAKDIDNLLNLIRLIRFW